MKILVINCGSSSIKYCFYDMDDEKLLARGLVERIGEKQSSHTHATDGNGWKREIDAPNHIEAMRHVAKALLDPKSGCIKDASEVAAIGHRVVHGGEEFVSSVVIDPRVEETIDRLAPLAPLHNPPNLAGIRGARAIFPEATQAAVFDTTFHRSMPEYAYVYGIPYEFYQEQKIRRYGFHGTSYRFVTHRAAELTGIPRDKFNAVVCHLGNGCSITAVKNGVSVDTSMGLTPLEGLLMGTRCGDIDPGVIFHLLRDGRRNAAQVEQMLQSRSGLLGLSGISNDQRPLVQAMPTNPRAKLAMDVFAYRIKKYIGSYMAVIGRTDAILFTGGIGERGIQSRKDICSGLENFGVKLDLAANEACKAKEARISAADSRVQIWVIPTNEELMIARDTAALAAGRSVD